MNTSPARGQRNHVRFESHNHAKPSRRPIEPGNVPVLDVLEDRLLMAALTNPIPAVIAPSAIQVQLQPVVTGLASPPTAMTDVGDGRLFLATRAGVIRIIQNGVLVAQPLLDITARTLIGGERGLLGMAMHPGFANPASPGFGKFYTYNSEAVAGPADFTTTVPLPAGVAMDHQAVITEWQTDPLNPNQALPASRRELMRIDEPQPNHNGGDIHFGPDGLLYIALGDGGASNDVGNGHSPQGNGQDATNILGSIVRIDVNGSNSNNGQYGIPATNPFVGRPGVPSLVDEIFAFGLRNPFRFSFDSLTGQLIAGDVGQNNVEEIDIITSGGNFGWAFREGTFAFNRADGTVSLTAPGIPAGLRAPILQYDHDEGVSVIGGFVYRGSAITELAGRYVFGDLAGTAGTGRLFVAATTGGAIQELVIGGAGLAQQLFGFGQDAAGELYVLGGNGDVFRIVTAPSISGQLFNDANRNGTREPAEKGMAGVTVFLDANNNGVRDLGEQVARTSRTGLYKFAGAPAGTHHVRVQTSRLVSVSAPIANLQDVTVADVGVGGISFGVYRNAGIARLASFTDASGDKVDILLAGPGLGSVVQPAGGDATSITLQGTTPASTLTIRSRGQTSIQDINVGGGPLRALTAKTTAVTGTLNLGAAGTVTLGSTGAAMAGTAGAIRTMTIWGDMGGTLTAVSIGTAGIKGNMNAATLNLTQPVVPATPAAMACNFLRISGGMVNSTVRSDGSIGTVSMVSMQGSDIFAGVTPATVDLPTAPAQFASDATIHSVTLSGRGVPFAMVDSNIAAANLARVSFRTVQTANGGVKFGLAGKTFGTLLVPNNQQDLDYRLL